MALLKISVFLDVMLCFGQVLPDVWNSQGALIFRLKQSLPEDGRTMILQNVNNYSSMTLHHKPNKL